jgi:hypothetical protein
MEVTKEEYLAAVERGATAAFADAAYLAKLKAKPSLSVKEAAACYGIGEGTLNKRRMQGLPPAYVKIGGSVFYKHEDILRYMEKNRVKVYES